MTDGYNRRKSCGRWKIQKHNEAVENVISIDIEIKYLKSIIRDVYEKSSGKCYI